MQPDLNWSTPEVRTAMADMLRFWIDRGVDGFRIDMIGFIGKDPAYRDEDVPTDGSIHDYFRSARHHFNRPDTIARLAELRRVVDTEHDRVVIGKVHYRTPDRTADRVRR